MRLIKNRGLRIIITLSIFAAVVIPSINISYIYPSFTGLLIEVTEQEAQRTGRHLTNMLVKNMPSINQEKITAAFTRKVGLLLKDFSIIKIKLLSAKGNTVFSTDEKDLNQVNSWRKSC